MESKVKQELLLIPEEIIAVYDIEEDVWRVNIAKAQLAKAEPLIRKDEKVEWVKRLLAEGIMVGEPEHLEGIRKSIEATAYKDERERILAILEKEYPAITTWQCWQSLKGGN